MNGVSEIPSLSSSMPEPCIQQPQVSQQREREREGSRSPPIAGVKREREDSIIHGDGDDDDAQSDVQPRSRVRLEGPTDNDDDDNNNKDNNSTDNHNDNSNTTIASSNMPQIQILSVVNDNDVDGNDDDDDDDDDEDENENENENDDSDSGSSTGDDTDEDDFVLQLLSTLGTTALQQQQQLNKKQQQQLQRHERQQRLHQLRTREQLEPIEQEQLDRSDECNGSTNDDASAGADAANATQSTLVTSEPDEDKPQDERQVTDKQPRKHKSKKHKSKKSKSKKNKSKNPSVTTSKSKRRSSNGHVDGSRNGTGNEAHQRHRRGSKNDAEQHEEHGAHDEHDEHDEQDSDEEYMEYDRPTAIRSQTIVEQQKLTGATKVWAEQCASDISNRRRSGVADWLRHNPECKMSRRTLARHVQAVQRNKPLPGSVGRKPTLSRTMEDAVLEALKEASSAGAIITDEYIGTVAKRVASQRLPGETDGVQARERIRRCGGKDWVRGWKARYRVVISPEGRLERSIAPPLLSAIAAYATASPDMEAPESPPAASPAASPTCSTADHLDATTAALDATSTIAIVAAVAAAAQSAAAASKTRLTDSVSCQANPTSLPPSPLLPTPKDLCGTSDTSNAAPKAQLAIRL